MKNNSLHYLILAGLILAAAQLFSGSVVAQESYPLMCRGVKGAEIAFETKSRMSFRFKKGTAKADSGADPASSGLAPGECSWSDRGMRDSEPDIFFHKVKDGTGLSDAEYTWTKELDNPDNYWVFDIAKNSDGQFVVMAARRAPRIANLPQNPRPAPTLRPDEAEMPDSKTVPRPDPKPFDIDPAMLGRALPDLMIREIQIVDVKTDLGVASATSKALRVHVANKGPGNAGPSILALSHMGHPGGKDSLGWERFRSVKVGPLEAGQEAWVSFEDFDPNSGDYVDYDGRDIGGSLMLEINPRFVAVGEESLKEENWDNNSFLFKPRAP